MRSIASASADVKVVVARCFLLARAFCFLQFDDSVTLDTIECDMIEEKQ